MTKQPFDLIFLGRPKRPREAVDFACRVVDLIDSLEMNTQEGVYLIGAFYLNTHAEEPRPL